MIRRFSRYLVRKGLQQGWQRGILGDSRAFVVIGGLALLAHLAGRAMPRQAELIFSDELVPGETFQIFHEPRP